jgi:hypothetical protein
VPYPETRPLSRRLLLIAVVAEEAPGPTLILHRHTFMGRTLHYSLFGTDQIPWDTRREIQLAQRMLDHHYSWTCENLHLDLFDQPELTYSDMFAKGYEPRLPRLGSGSTKVRGDEWHAHLLITFLLWVSSRLPEVTVRVMDEGDYILGGYLVLQHGVLALDLIGMAHWREYLRSGEFEDVLARLDDAERQATAGVFFGPVFALEYADRPEVAKLGLTDKALAKTTLKEVSEAITMPWQTEWLEKGMR